MAVVERANVDDIRLAHFVDELSDDLIKVILADLHAVCAPNRFDMKALVTFLRRGIQRFQRLGDQALCSPFVLWHGKMLVLASGGGGQDGINDARRSRSISPGDWNRRSVRNDNVCPAGRTFNLGTTPGGIDREGLAALGTLKFDVHKLVVFFSGSGITLSAEEKNGELKLDRSRWRK